MLQYADKCCHGERSHDQAFVNAVCQNLSFKILRWKCTYICWSTVMTPRMWQLHQYNHKPLSSFVSLCVVIFAALVNFFPSKLRTEISIWVQSHTPRFHWQRLFVTKMQFLSFYNKSNVSDTVPYNVVFAWETTCVIPGIPQPFSASNIWLKCCVSLFLLYLMLLSSPTLSFISLCQVMWTQLQSKCCQ